MAFDDSPRVLLVDDDPDFLRVVEAQLERIRTDLDVETEANPTSALDRLASSEVPDCVVSDYRMPEMNGIELLSAVRDRDIDVPFILLTAEGDEEVASDAIDAGATNYLRKQTVGRRVEKLATAVEDAVTTYRERRLLREEFEFVDRVLGTLDDIVYATDTDGRPLYWNDAANDVTGYTSAEARSLDVRDLFPPEEHDRVEAAIDTIVESGSVTFESELLTKDGRRIPYEFSGTALRDESGNVVGICGTGRDITRRVHYERTLRALHETTRTLLAATDPETVAANVASATGHIVNNPLSTVYLREGDSLVSAATTDELRRLVGDVPEYDVDEDVPAARAFRTGDPELVEDVSDIDDHRTRNAGSALYLSLGDHGVLALARHGGRVLDPTDRQLAEILAANAGVALQRLDRELALAEREWMLETLHGTTRELMRTHDPGEIARVLVDDASDVLDFSASAAFLWDDETGRLRVAAETDEFARVDAAAELRSVSGPGHPVWDAFVSAEPRVSSPESAESPGSRLLVPIGDRGVFVSVSPGCDGFDEFDVEFAELLVANASTALGRAERERSLREKDRQLQRRNEQLRRVNRLNAIIRDINGALLRANSRADIQQVVCDTLLDVEHYSFTWIGSADTAGGTGTGTKTEVVPRASAGEGRSFLDAVVESDETSVPERVLSEGDPVVVDSVHRDPTFAAWREPALNRGFRSLVCLPLTWADHEYGVLEIYADQTGVFGDDELDVLSELATQIANAITAVERKEALLTGRATEIEFELRDVDDPVFRLAERAETALDVEGVSPHGSDAWSVYATIRDADPTSFVAAADESTVVSDVDVIRTRGETTLLRLVVAEFAVVDAVADESATIRGLRVGGDSGRVTVTIPASASVRSFLESCRERFPELRLVRRQSATDAATTDGLKYDIGRMLTEKQLEALQTAYFGGYFEWPRNATSEEIAAMLGVSRPTFLQHLRKALARIFEDAFGAE